MRHMLQSKVNFYFFIPYQVLKRHTLLFFEKRKKCEISTLHHTIPDAAALAYSNKSRDFSTAHTDTRGATHGNGSHEYTFAIGVWSQSYSEASSPDLWSLWLYWVYKRLITYLMDIHLLSFASHQSVHLIYTRRPNIYWVIRDCCYFYPNHQLMSLLDKGKT